jgi:hypothetical protein
MCAILVLSTCKYHALLLPFAVSCGYSSISEASFSCNTLGVPFLGDQDVVCLHSGIRQETDSENSRENDSVRDKQPKSHKETKQYCKLNDWGTYMISKKYWSYTLQTLNFIKIVSLLPMGIIKQMNYLCGLNKVSPLIFKVSRLGRYTVASVLNYG